MQPWVCRHITKGVYQASDALWGWEPVMVEGTVRTVCHTVSFLHQVAVKPSYPPLGPHPLKDIMGFLVTIAMLLKS
jgi:hypothetical protein